MLQVQRAIAGLDLPNNPLDELIDRLGGPAAVAEMTGRKGRLVRRKDGETGGLSQPCHMQNGDGNLAVQFQLTLSWSSVQFPGTISVVSAVHDCRAVLEWSGSTCSGLVPGAGVKWEARNASGVDKGSSLEMINILERKMFLSGEKLVAVISEAASAGISLHADRWLARLLYANLPPLACEFTVRTRGAGVLRRVRDFAHGC